MFHYYNYLQNFLPEKHAFRYVDVPYLSCIIVHPVEMTIYSYQLNFELFDLLP